MIHESCHTHTYSVKQNVTRINDSWHTYDVTNEYIPPHVHAFMNDS